MNTQVEKRFTTVTAALQDACRKSDKTMDQIAQLAGFNSAYEWQQVVDGLVELDGMKIAAVARALQIDPIELARVHIADYSPDFLELFDAIPREVMEGDMSSIPYPSAGGDDNPSAGSMGVHDEEK